MIDRKKWILGASGWRYVVMVLTLALLMAFAVNQAGLTKDNDKEKEKDKEEYKVKAHIDADCKSHPKDFTVPDGKTAVDFKKVELDPGKACHDSGAPENKGFSIRNDKNKHVYMWSQYQDQQPYEKGGPLSSLTLPPGKYTLTVAGGANAKIEISYKLK